MEGDCKEARVGEDDLVHALGRRRVDGVANLADGRGGLLLRLREQCVEQVWKPDTDSCLGEVRALVLGHDVVDPKGRLVAKPEA